MTRSIPMPLSCVTSCCRTPEEQGRAEAPTATAYYCFHPSGAHGGIDDCVSCLARTGGGNHTDYLAWHPHPDLATGGAHDGHHSADTAGHRHQSPLRHATPSLGSTCCASQR